MRAAVGDRRGMDAGPLLDPAGELCLPVIRAHIEERTRSARRPPIRRKRPSIDVSPLATGIRRREEIPGVAQNVDLLLAILA